MNCAYNVSKEDFFLKKSSKKTIQSVGLLIFLGVGVHLLIPQLTSIQNSMDVLRNLKYWALAIAFLCEFLSYVGSAYLLVSIVELFHNHISIWRSLLIGLASASFGMVAGGMFGSGAISYQWIKKNGIKSQAAALSSSLPLLMNNIAVLLISLIGVVYLLIMHDLSKAQIIGFLVILFLLLFVIILIILFLYRREQSSLFLFQMMKKLSKILKRPYDEKKITDQIHDMYQAWDIIIDRGWKKPVLGVVMNFGFDIAALYFLFIAGNHSVTPGVLLIGYGLPLLLGKAAFVIPGGVGVVEGTMVALYDKLGVPDPVTVVVVIAYRLVSFWLPSLIGFPLIALMQKQSNKETE